MVSYQVKQNAEKWRDRRRLHGWLEQLALADDDVSRMSILQSFDPTMQPSKQLAAVWSFLSHRIVVKFTSRAKIIQGGVADFVIGRVDRAKLPASGIGRAISARRRSLSNTRSKLRGGDRGCFSRVERENYTAGSGRFDRFRGRPRDDPPFLDRWEFSPRRACRSDLGEMPRRIRGIETAVIVIHSLDISVFRIERIIRWLAKGNADSRTTFCLMISQKFR